MTATAVLWTSLVLATSPAGALQATGGGGAYWADIQPDSGAALVADVESAGRERARGPASALNAGPLLVEAGGRVFFPAHEPATGVEPWSSDGTPQGTLLVQDIAPGAASSDPRGLAVVGERLYFAADDGAHGREPWFLPLPPHSSDEADASAGTRARLHDTPRAGAVRALTGARNSRSLAGRARGRQLSA